MTDARARAYYDDFAARYERGRDVGYHALLDDLELSIVLPRCEGCEVLELGCGTGLLLARVARVASRAVGIDLSPGMLEQARTRGLSVLEGSVTALPFDDASFDVVYSFKVLPHVPDLRRALEEASRVTRPGGMVIVELYNRLSLRHLVKRLAGPRKVSETLDESDVFTRWDTPRSARAAVPSGLRIVETVGIRVATPAAFLHRVPGVRGALGRLERSLLRSPLRHFGGFYVLVLEKS
jgi:ubiquinone/menaquinone biosynthesis C-methylase UbiE